MPYCKDCSTEKPADEFGKNKRSKNGLSWACKKCSREYQKRIYWRGKDGAPMGARRLRRELRAEINALELYETWLVDFERIDKAMPRVHLKHLTHAVCRFKTEFKFRSHLLEAGLLFVRVE